jgi:hypothetical protein
LARAGARPLYQLGSEFDRERKISLGCSKYSDTLITASEVSGQNIVYCNENFSGFSVNLGSRDEGHCLLKEVIVESEVI